jgi:hypothetical protein
MTHQIPRTAVAAPAMSTLAILATTRLFPLWFNQQVDQIRRLYVRMGFQVTKLSDLTRKQAA